MSAYTDWIGKFDSTKAKKLSVALKAKIDRMWAQGNRSARRHEDAGPLDIMSERIAPLQNKLDLLLFYLKGVDAPKAVRNEFEQHAKDSESTQAFKQQRLAKFSKYPSLVGKEIHWVSKGQKYQGIVNKQAPGKWSDEPMYRVQIGTMRWKIPHRMVTKTVTPKGNPLAAQQNQANKAKVAVQAFKPGQKVTWNSKRMGKEVTGSLTKIGRTKVKVDVNGSMWTVPLSLVTKIDGKPFKV